MKLNLIKTLLLQSKHNGKVAKLNICDIMYMPNAQMYVIAAKVMATCMHNMQI